MSEKLYFASDYMQGAHPAVLQRLLENNLVPSAGYGTDAFSEAAREKIRRACPMSFSSRAAHSATPWCSPPC